ncbi:MAG: c-type cytochrome [Acidobacteriota bacterium]|nr:c-type cytochrome [Acidobacteriota bacterium]
MKRVFACLVAAGISVCVAQEMHSGSEKKNPLAGEKSAIDAGQHRFREGCAACHGANAEGGRGPNLAQNRDLLRMSDEQLFNTIRRGIPGTSMPPSQMPDQQTWEVAAFVRSLSSPAAFASVPGDPHKGKALFYGEAHCASCHAVRGDGGLVGPDLSGVGGTLTVNELRESIAQPSARITPGFDAVTVRLKNGTVIKGVAKNDSDHSIDVLDMTGSLHLLSKADVREIEFSRKSLMPDNFAQTLGPDGVNDIMAFLAEQVVRPGAALPERRRWRGIQ